MPYDPSRYIQDFSWIANAGAQIAKIPGAVKLNDDLKARRVSNGDILKSVENQVKTTPNGLYTKLGTSKQEMLATIPEPSRREDPRAYVKRLTEWYGPQVRKMSAVGATSEEMKQFASTAPGGDVGADLIKGRRGEEKQQEITGAAGRAASSVTTPMLGPQGSEVSEPSPQLAGRMGPADAIPEQNPPTDFIPAPKTEQEYNQRYALEAEELSPDITQQDTEANPTYAAQTAGRQSVGEQQRGVKEGRLTESDKQRQQRFDDKMNYDRWKTMLGDTQKRTAAIEELEGEMSGLEADMVVLDADLTKLKKPAQTMNAMGEMEEVPVDRDQVQQMILSKQRLQNRIDNFKTLQQHRQVPTGGAGKTGPSPGPATPRPAPTTAPAPAPAPAAAPAAGPAGLPVGIKPVNSTPEIEGKVLEARKAHGPGSQDPWPEEKFMRFWQSLSGAHPANPQREARVGAAGRTS